MGEVDRKSLCLHHRYELDGKSTSDLVEDTFNQCLTFHKGMNISNKYVIWDNPLEIGKTRSSPSCYSTICGNCSLKIFMKSDYLKLFENKILNDKKGDNIIEKSKNKNIYALFCVDSAHHIINRMKLSLVYLTLLQYKPILDIICCHKTLFRRMIRILFHDLEFWVKMDEEWDKHDLIRGDLESLNLYSLKSDIGHIRTLFHNFQKQTVDFLRKYKCLKWFIETDKSKWFKKYVCESLESNENFQQMLKRQKWRDGIYLYPLHVTLLIRRFINSDHTIYKRIKQYIPFCVDFFIKMWPVNTGELMIEMKEFSELYRRKRKNKISCNNCECKRDYTEWKYGMEYYDEDTDAHEHKKRGYKHENVWKEKIINKWYKCKRCKIAYYCSRKCQKLDWNRYDHKLFCKNMHYNVK